MTIDRKLILANAPSNMGEQVHVNHTGCEAGEDKKRRLYIKRTDKGLVAYCHHCNEKGFASDNSARLSTWLTSSTKTTKEQKRKPTLAPLSLGGKVWLTNYNCPTRVPNFMGVEGDPSRVALMLYDLQNNPVGMQIRSLRPDADLKYVTYFDNSNSDVAWFYNGNKTLVITEDYLSAYRVQRDVGFSSMALLRTSITDRTLTQIYDTGFNEIYIWLDSDDAGAVGAAKVSKTLQHFLPADVKLLTIHSNEEPKECTSEQLVSKFL